MRATPFPAHPSEVATLTVPEFTYALDLEASVSFDAICQRFVHDANRALVWFIRFRALTDLRDRTEIAAWLQSEPRHVQHVCELAASFELNEDWEFDAERFRSALESVDR
jgi:hypothetical protein